MKASSSASARALAAAALICGFLIVVVVIATSLDGGGDGDGGNGNSPAAQSGKVPAGNKGSKAPEAYVVQNGDTLTSIARKTGVSVARIQQLNPGVDPQILVSGERLKLR